MKFLKSIMAAALITTAVSSGAMAGDVMVDLESKGTGSVLKVSYAAVEKALKSDAELKSGINGTLTHDIIVEASKAVLAAAQKADGAKYNTEDAFLAELRNALPGVNTVDVETILNPGVDEQSVADKDLKPIVKKLMEVLSAAMKLEDSDEASIRKISSYAHFEEFKILKVDGSGKTLEEILADPKQAKGVTIEGISLTDIAAGKGEARLQKIKKMRDDAETHKAALAAKDVEIDAHKKESEKHKTAFDDLTARVAPHKAFIEELEAKYYPRLRAVLQGKKTVKGTDLITGDMAKDLPSAISYIAGLETQVNELTKELGVAQAAASKAHTATRSAHKTAPNDSQQATLSDASQQEALPTFGLGTNSPQGTSNPAANAANVSTDSGSSSAAVPVGVVDDFGQRVG